MKKLKKQKMYLGYFFFFFFFFKKMVLSMYPLGQRTRTCSLGIRFPFPLLFNSLCLFVKVERSIDCD